ncbi:MAG: arginase family protein [Salinibacterium sp.]|nr:arginase family protein [Salinibacterium sp.]
MTVTFVVVPQWQGSGSPRAMRLVDGADAIRGDLPSATTRIVDVPLEAGDEQGSGVHRLSAIVAVRDNLVRELSTIDGVAVTIGGDCGVELGAVSHALDADVAVLWFDAHPDLNTPASSPSGAFTGMVLRTLLGDGPAALVPGTALSAERVVLVGARAFDPEEDAVIAARGIRTIDAETLSPETLIAAVEATGARRVYVHIDLDVLDPADMTGLGSPQPFGVRASLLVESIRALLGSFPLAGAGITEFAPATPEGAVEDLPTILRLIGALNS